MQPTGMDMELKKFLANVTILVLLKEGVDEREPLMRMTVKRIAAKRLHDEGFEGLPKGRGTGVTGG